MKPLLCIVLLSCVCAIHPAMAQNGKMLTPAEITALMANSPTSYVVTQAPSDSIRRVAIAAMFPLQEAYVANPLVTGPEGNRTVEANEFPGLTSELFERAEKPYDPKNIPAARAANNDIIKAVPSCYPAVANLGDCYMLEGKLDSAVMQYDLAIKMAPLDYVDYLYKADVLYKAGRYDEARKALIELLSLRPRYATARRMAHGMTKLGITVHDSLFAPAGYAIKNGDDVKIICSDDKSASPWMGYAMGKGVWLGEPDHRKSLTGSTNLSWSDRHELECLAMLITIYEGQKKNNEGKISGLESIESVVDDGLSQAFVLYEVASRMDENIMLKASDAEREGVRKYIGKYILPKS